MSLYSNELRTVAETIAAAKTREADDQRRMTYQERCQEREAALGETLDRMTPGELEALARRKFVYLPALERWQKAGRPITGRWREDLLFRLEVERAEPEVPAIR